MVYESILVRLNYLHNNNKEYLMMSLRPFENSVSFDIISERAIIEWDYYNDAVITKYMNFSVINNKLFIKEDIPTIDVKMTISYEVVFNNDVNKTMKYHNAHYIHIDVESDLDESASREEKIKAFKNDISNYILEELKDSNIRIMGAKDLEKYYDFLRGTATYSNYYMQTETNRNNDYFYIGGQERVGVLAQQKFINMTKVDIIPKLVESIENKKIEVGIK